MKNLVLEAELNAQGLKSRHPSLTTKIKKKATDILDT